MKELNNYFLNKFTDGIRVLMLINRGINNSNKGSKRWINKIITTNTDEWKQAFAKLVELQTYLGDPDIRLYSCLNDRKLDKAITMFKHKQLDLQDDNRIKFYCNITDTFASCLMKPENRNSKYFLLDIDSYDLGEVEDFIKMNDITIVYSYPTKNGFHYIVTPFNVKLAQGKETFSVKKDALLLLNILGE